MRSLVMKFGGAAVSSPDSFARIAEIILYRARSFSRIVVVVSAMGGMTDHLVSLAHEINPQPPRRELDMLVSVGERISVSLLAMALAHKGAKATSFTGSQSGIITTSDHTEARILDVRPHRLEEVLDEGGLVLVAGFQGVSRERDITTLGRGGSDTTAVALGVALDSERVEFYKDVGAIYTADPKTSPYATRCKQLDYEEALLLCSASPRGVLHPRCVALAAKNRLPLQIHSFSTFPPEDAPGTTISGPRELANEEKIFEECSPVVSNQNMGHYAL